MYFFGIYTIGKKSCSFIQGWQIVEKKKNRIFFHINNIHNRGCLCTRSLFQLVVPWSRDIECPPKTDFLLPIHLFWSKGILWYGVDSWFSNQTLFLSQ